MKTKFTLLLALTILLFSIPSCGDDIPEKTVNKEAGETTISITGRWKLTRSQNTSASNDQVEYADQPTDVILHLQKNGYFIVYDTFTSPSWKQKGLPLIQQRSRGQWTLEGKQLQLNYFSDDSNFTEELEVTKLSQNELVTRGKDKKSNVYKTYGK